MRKSMSDLFIPNINSLEDFVQVLIEELNSIKEFNGYQFTRGVRTTISYRIYISNSVSLKETPVVICVHTMAQLISIIKINTIGKTTIIFEFDYANFKDYLFRINDFIDPIVKELSKLKI